MQRSSLSALFTTTPPAPRTVLHPRRACNMCVINELTSWSFLAYCLYHAVSYQRTAGAHRMLAARDSYVSAACQGFLVCILVLSHHCHSLLTQSLRPCSSRATHTPRLTRTILNNEATLAKVSLLFEVPQKLNTRTIIWFNNPTLGAYREELKARSQRPVCTLCSQQHDAQRPRGGQPKCLWELGWIKKMRSIHPVEYCWTLKKKEILSHAPTKLNLKDIMPSEVSQSQKHKYCLSPFIGDVRSSHIHRDRNYNRMVVVRSWDKGGQGSCSVGVEF